MKSLAGRTNERTQGRKPSFFSKGRAIRRGGITNKHKNAAGGVRKGGGGWEGEMSGKGKGGRGGGVQGEATSQEKRTKTR